MQNLLAQAELQELFWLLNINHVHTLKALRRRQNYLGLNEHLRERFNLKLSPERTIPKLVQQLVDFNLAYRVNPCSSCKAGCVHQITEKGELFLSFYSERDKSYDLSEGCV